MTVGSSRSRSRSGEVLIGEEEERAVDRAFHRIERDVSWRWVTAIVAPAAILVGLIIAIVGRI